MQRWWVAVLVCAALSVVPFAAALYLDAAPVEARPQPSPPLSHHTAPEAEADIEIVPPPSEVERMDAPPALDDAEEPVAVADNARVSGRVVDERGFAVTRFHLAIESFWPASDTVDDRRTARRRINVDDDDGRFELDGLAPGTYVLAVRADGHPPSNSERLELRAGDDERGVRIVLAQGGAVEGRVHDGGTPIAGARVSLDLTSGAFGSTASAVSDDSGAYRLDGIPSGPVSLRFEAKGYGTRIVSAVTARAGQVTTQDVELAAGETSTEYAGIGAMLSVHPEGIAFGRLIEGGPAERAGLVAGDRLLRVDGEDARSWTMAQAVQRLRGAPGSRVSIRVVRNGSEVEVVVTRDRFVR